MSLREEEIGQVIEHFKRPSFYKPKEILEDPSIVPDSKGIYGWYFDTLFPPYMVFLLILILTVSILKQFNNLVLFTFVTLFQEGIV